MKSKSGRSERRGRKRMRMRLCEEKGIVMIWTM